MSDERYSVTGSNFALDAKQKELIGIAEELGPAFAGRAARYDREASFPFENYADLRKAGLLGVCVPEKFGGRGADLATYSIVSATLILSPNTSARPATGSVRIGVPTALPSNSRFDRKPLSRMLSQ